jgi:short subunit fatty acids transporter
MKQAGPKKTSGMHRCIPDSSFRICTYLFFLAFFFAAILFSSELFEIRASFAGGARIQSHV